MDKKTKGKSPTTGLRVEKSLYERVRTIAKRKRRPVSTQAAIYLENGVKQEEGID
jgi:hypothetical protein